MMKWKLVTMLVVIASLLVGCGASKSYVDEQVAASESRYNADIAKLRDQSDANADQLARLQGLADQLSQKTDMAVNMAKGFEDYQTLWTGVINFGFDSYDVTGEAEQILMECGDKLNEHPEGLVEIAGHTDATGTAKYNMMLGEMRAESAKRFLTERYGVSLYRMFTVSYGKTKPAATSMEQQNAAKNRRVTLTVWGRP
jgi:outer membrane protein OmpA-like peptidoglycan-associated protein